MSLTRPFIVIIAIWKLVYRLNMPYGWKKIIKQNVKTQNANMLLNK